MARMSWAGWVVHMATMQWVKSPAMQEVFLALGFEAPSGHRVEYTGDGIGERLRAPCGCGWLDGTVMCSSALKVTESSCNSACYRGSGRDDDQHIECRDEQISDSGDSFL